MYSCKYLKRHAVTEAEVLRGELHSAQSNYVTDQGKHCDLGNGVRIETSLVITLSSV